MTDWHQDELVLLRSTWPSLRFEPAGYWILIEQFKIVEGWSRTEIDLAIRLPPNLPGQEPYGFWVKGGISLESGNLPSNYTFPSETIPFTGDNQWGQFSWSFNNWAPGAAAGDGTSMVHFVRSVSRRFRELN